MTKSLNQISDILVNMLKKEKKKTQDALLLMNTEKSDARLPQNSPFIPGSPAGQSTSVSSALSQAQDLSICRHRSSLLHRKTGGFPISPAFFITRDGVPHHILSSELCKDQVSVDVFVRIICLQVKCLFPKFTSEWVRINKCIMVDCDVVWM